MHLYILKTQDKRDQKMSTQVVHQKKKESADNILTWRGSFGKYQLPQKCTISGRRWRMTLKIYIMLKTFSLTENQHKWQNIQCTRSSPPAPASFFSVCQGEFYTSRWVVLLHYLGDIRCNCSWMKSKTIWIGFCLFFVSLWHTPAAFKGVRDSLFSINKQQKCTATS